MVPCSPHEFLAGIITPFTDKSLEQRLKEIEEECKRKESRRVDLELSLVEVKENLKKAESGPVTLGTAVDTTHLENTAPRVCGDTPRLHSSIPAPGMLHSLSLLNIITNNNIVLL